VFLLLLTAFVVRTLKTFLTRWGLPILATGILSFLIALLGAPLIGFVIKFLIQTQASQFASPVLLAALSETTSAVAREILTPTIIQGGVLTMIGLAMSLIGIFLPKPPQLSTY
jgi:hypothetical protein